MVGGVEGTTVYRIPGTSGALQPIEKNNDASPLILGSVPTVVRVFFYSSDTENTST